MIWHILKKDLRRLAIPVAVSLALVAALSVLDTWRHDFEAGLAETVLNLLVPLAWAVLIAMAVQLEPLTSDTAFWLTRPYRRSRLLLAKVAFALIVVHVPLLISHAVILMSHGFAPMHPQLWWKQLTVLLAITVPSLAIASMTTTVAGFGWCALAAGATALLLDAALVGRRYPWIQTEWMPVALALLLLTAGAAVIIALQYVRRTIWTGRAVGLAMAVGAVLTYSYVPREFTAALQCSVEPDAPSGVTVRFHPDGAIQPLTMMGRPDRVGVSIPVQVTGVEDARHIWAEQLWLRVSAPNGQAWETKRDIGLDRRAFLSVNLEEQASAQHIAPDRTFVNAVGSAPLKLEGRATVRPVRALEPKVLPSTFPQTDVPNVGRCSASLDMAFFGREMLKVVCESPAELPRMMRIRMVDPVTGREWRHGLGDATSSHLPTIVWLSPLNRRQTFMQTVQKASDHPGDRWLVPRDVIGRSKIHIEPWIPQGCANVDYSFEVADVRRWEVRDQRYWQLR